MKHYINEKYLSYKSSLYFARHGHQISLSGISYYLLKDYTLYILHFYGVS